MTGQQGLLCAMLERTLVRTVRNQGGSKVLGVLSPLGGLMGDTVLSPLRRRRLV